MERALRTVKTLSDISPNAQPPFVRRRLLRPPAQRVCRPAHSRPGIEIRQRNGREAASCWGLRRGCCSEPKHLQGGSRSRIRI